MFYHQLIAQLGYFGGSNKPKKNKCKSNNNDDDSAIKDFQLDLCELLLFMKIYGSRAV